MKFQHLKGALLKTALCFSLVLLIAGENLAQDGIFSKKNKINRYSYLSIGGGSSHYFGDLAPYRVFYYSLYTNVRWNATLNYTRQLSPRVGARIGFTYARIAGDDFNFAQRNLTRYYANYLRNLHFRNDIKEFTLSGVFNLLPQTGKGQQGRRNFMPYAVLGIGFYGHNPVAKAPVTIESGVVSVTKGWVPLKTQTTAGQGLDPSFPKSYSLLQVVFPGALGLKMKINEKFDLNFECGLRITPFDYLDDVSADKYPNPTLLGDAKIYSNRTAEDYSARTGKDRIPVFEDIMTNPVYGLNKSGVITPSAMGEQNIGIGYAAGLGRGTPKWDSYFVSQITISYIIGSTIKCPPIK
ncbi:DUF6089 family protein [Emticicia sp. BO119]|uniref:DUF6089 family protein n=1 Tax=Emticicia sp. BO119 TaxID=2757768 RepID=UPI0015EFE0A3|nr:hypothetical protein [Emticicia sp. BO119]MBA4851743.1 hypothetical protein [Emticicia sp. BO119]